MSTEQNLRSSGYAAMKHADALVILGSDFPYPQFFPKDAKVIRQADPVARKVVMFNNGALAFVELEMKAAGYVNFGTDVDDPDFSQLATSCGLLGLRVTSAMELHAKMKQFLAHDGPALLDVKVQRQEL
jgi:pyruvate dehydrogenase (quinone)